MDTGSHISHLSVLGLSLSFSLLLSPRTGFGLGRTCAKKITGLKIWQKGWKSALRTGFVPVHFSHTSICSRVATWTSAAPHLKWNFWWLLGRACVSPLAREGTSGFQIRLLTSKHPFVRWIPLYRTGRDLIWIQSRGQNKLSYSQASSIILSSSVII